jgi:hypothetical protein
MNFSRLLQVGFSPLHFIPTSHFTAFFITGSEYIGNARRTIYHRDPRMELLFQCVHNDQAILWQVQRRTYYHDAIVHSFGGSFQRTSVASKLASLMSVDTIIVAQLLGQDQGVGHCVSIVRAPNQVTFH